MSDQPGPSLGDVLSRHPVNNRRRWTVGLVWSLLGVVLGVLAGPLVFVGSDDVANHVAVVVAAVICLGVGGANLVKAMLRNGECFELRQHGLVHITAGRTRAWPWSSFGSVRIGRGTEAFVEQYSCVATLTDGRKVRFNALVSGHEQLGQAIVDAARRR